VAVLDAPAEAMWLSHHDDADQGSASFGCSVDLAYVVVALRSCRRRVGVSVERVGVDSGAGIRELRGCVVTDSFGAWRHDSSDSGSLAPD